MVTKITSAATQGPTSTRRPGHIVNANNGSLVATEPPLLAGDVEEFVALGGLDDDVPMVSIVRDGETAKVHPASVAVMEGWGWKVA